MKLVPGVTLWSIIKNMMKDCANRDAANEFS
jgi:hypothetical protein